MYHILVAGAGYAGSRIASHFIEKKQKVWALTRTGARNAEFLAQGITPVTADLAKSETLAQIPPAHFIVLCPAPDGHGEADYRRVYLDGISNLLKSLAGKPKPFFILYLSSTSVWKDRDGGWVDESEAPDAGTEKGKILIEAERQVLGSGYPSAVFRLAGIYGPGRNRIAFLKAGKNPEQTRDGWMNLIHVDDIVRAVPVLFKKGKEGEIYTGADDCPVLRSEFYPWLASYLGMERKFSFSPPPEGKRCRNAKLKALGFEFLYPDFKKGYAAADL